MKGRGYVRSALSGLAALIFAASPALSQTKEQSLPVHFHKYDYHVTVELDSLLSARDSATIVAQFDSVQSHSPFLDVKITGFRRVSHIGKLSSDTKSSDIDSSYHARPSEESYVMQFVQAPYFLEVQSSASAVSSNHSDEVHILGYTYAHDDFVYVAFPSDIESQNALWSVQLHEILHVQGFNHSLGTNILSDTTSDEEKAFEHVPASALYAFLEERPPLAPYDTVSNFSSSKNISLLNLTTKFALDLSDRAVYDSCIVDYSSISDILDVAVLFAPTPDARKDIRRSQAFINYVSKKQTKLQCDKSPYDAKKTTGPTGLPR